MSSAQIFKFSVDFLFNDVWCSKNWEQACGSPRQMGLGLISSPYSLVMVGRNGNERSRVTRINMAAAESSQPSVPNDRISDWLQTVRSLACVWNGAILSMHEFPFVILLFIYLFLLYAILFFLSCQDACKLMRLVEAGRKYGVQFYYSN